MIEIPDNAKILLIRRDNIGDLLLTTPLIHTLRQRYPRARIDLLVNSYNAPIIQTNPDVNTIHVYTKGKHRGARSLAGIYLQRLKMYLTMRKVGYDLAILTTTHNPRRDYRLARSAGAKIMVGFSSGAEDSMRPLLQHPIDNPWSGSLHLVEELAHITRAFGIDAQPGPLVLVPDALEVAKARKRIGIPAGLVLGIHISARKPPQRWPVERFSELIRRLHADGQVGHFLLFWSPGPANHPQHPGDDEKAAQLLELTRGLPVTPFSTRHLPELVAGLSLTDQVICSDGGGMHVAAALGKPILCFFGNSDPVVWHPWGVPHELLRPASENVSNVSVEDTLEAWRRLNRNLESSSTPR